MCLLILPSQCCLVQGRIKELGSSSVRQWKGATADPLWVRHNILALPGLGSVQTLPALEASFQLWELVEVQWWKLGCWAPHSWVLGLVIPSIPCHLQLQSQGLGRSCTGGLQQGSLLHMQSLRSRIISQPLYPPLLFSVLLQQADVLFAMAGAVWQGLPGVNTGQLLLKFRPDLHQL